MEGLNGLGGRRDAKIWNGAGIEGDEEFGAVLEVADGGRREGREFLGV